MNRDIVLGSSIVLSALVLAGAVLVHDSNRLKSLRIQHQIASAVEANSDRQTALQEQTQKILERHFRQEQQFIGQQFASQRQTLKQAWSETANEIAAGADQNELGDSSVASANDASAQFNFSSTSTDNSLASVDSQTIAPEASDPSEQPDN